MTARTLAREALERKEKREKWEFLRLELKRGYWPKSAYTQLLHWIDNELPTDPCDQLEALDRPKAAHPTAVSPNQPAPIVVSCS